MEIVSFSIKIPADDFQLGEVRVPLPNDFSGYMVNAYRIKNVLYSGHDHTNYKINVSPFTDTGSLQFTVYKDGSIYRYTPRYKYGKFGELDVTYKKVSVFYPDYIAIKITTTNDTVMLPTDPNAHFIVEIDLGIETNKNEGEPNLVY